MARLRYSEIAPEGFAALTAFGHYLNAASSLDPVLKGFVDLRASQINGCGFCVAMHTAELRKHHEPESRIAAIAEWQSPAAADIFTPRERAALAWTETLTALNGSHASDEDYAAVSEFFQSRELVDLTYAIANINAWNRLGIAFRAEWNPQMAADASEKLQPADDDRQPTRSAVADDGGKVAED
jgi:AhpD family alkylhydroperoxidase